MVKRWGVMILLLVTVLAGCRSSPAPTRTPIAIASPSAAGPRSRGDTVAASGEVVPAREARLGFAGVGLVEAVPVAVGDQVAAGQPLVQLRTAEMDGAVAQAEAQLDIARVDLALVRATSLDAEIAMAEAGVSAAQAQLAVAREGVESVKAAVVTVEEQITLAQAGLSELTAGPTEAELQIARLQIKQAENASWAVQAQRDAVCGRIGRGATDADCDSAEAAVGSAHEAVRIAELQLAQLEAGPTEVQLAGARAQVRIAQARKAEVDAALEVARAQVEPARAAVRQAEAQLEQVQSTASTRESGIARAKAAVTSAEAGMARSQAALDAAVLKAPFAGTVTTLDAAVGEVVMPGGALLTLADLGRLQIETTDLSERDVGRVAAGQRVTVYMEALGEEIGGHVVRIADEATTIGGDVVYKVVIELDEQPSDLRWGMSVEVEITTS